MNRPIRKVAVALLVLLAAMFVNLNFVQVVKGNEYRNHPDNSRVLLAEYSNPRGQIVVQGTAIATSKSTKDELKYLRTYPQGPEYAAVTGSYSFVYGTNAMENAENDVLSGNDNRLFGSQLADLFTGRNPRGGSVELTLNKSAQDAAYKAMRSPDGTFRRGAVVALDPSTGAILALVSTPSYDPNQLSSHDSRTISHAYACYSDLDTAQRKGESDAELEARIAKQIAAREPDPRTKSKGCSDVPDDPTAFFKQNPRASGPMLNRAFNQLYAPGSVFKVIDSAAALKDGIKPTQSIPAPNSYWPLEPKRKDRCSASSSGACVENFQGETCQNGTTATLAFALAKSCNTAFAQLVVTTKNGGKKITDQAKKFGFEDPYSGDPHNFCDPAGLTVPLGVCRSSPGSTEDLADKAALAQTSFGQRDVRMTPLQGAMISAAVANGGTLMQPYLVQKELGPNLSVLKNTDARQLSQAVDPSHDEDLKNLMFGVIENPEGTGGPARITDIPGVRVGGKTGTADTGFCVVGGKQGPCGDPAFQKGQDAPPHAWFSGFAMRDGNPKIAVAVIIENGGVNGSETTGGLAAAPVAKAVMEAYLKSGAGR
ncbi:MAG: penicillin-binding transpeptidase domain-containing protein [Pseudonocardiales bacterium]|nr:penicillin-binding transpeptidase domain-containing protein [Actinomycetota bacterium]